MTEAQRLQVNRQTLRRTRRVADPDATRPLAEGEVRLALGLFALTANNVTYAAFGEAMRYWQFFPCADEGWGHLPVWGFATVAESRAEGVAVGRRVWGFLPCGSHLVVQPGRVNAGGFVDGAAHRQELAAIYNHYGWCDADPAWTAAGEPLQALLKPLFTTSFLLDDFLAEAHWHGARQLLLSSASSKTAFGTAFCLAQRRGQAGLPEVIGLTSAGNLGFTQALGCYDRVLSYDAVDRLDPQRPTVYIDFAGSAPLRRAVHPHFGEALRYSCAIGGTHWAELGPGGGLPGPRPVLFFAPAQAKLRSGPPPAGWGPGGLAQRLGGAWAAFVQQVQVPAQPWVQVVHHAGLAAAEQAWAALVDGRADARSGLVFTPAG